MIFTYALGGRKRKVGDKSAREGGDSYFCYSWSCETIASSWTPEKGDYITLKRGGNYNSYTWKDPGGNLTLAFQAKSRGHGPIKAPNGQPLGWGGACQEATEPSRNTEGHCNTVLLSFTKARKTQRWESGRTWGIRLYASGYDPGQLFTVRVVNAHIWKPKPVGPNITIAPREPQFPKQKHSSGKYTTPS